MTKTPKKKLRLRHLVRVEEEVVLAIGSAAYVADVVVQG